jgi:ribonuclease HI
MVYYAVHKGRQVGIYTDWATCKLNTQGFKNAVFQKFSNKQDAENFVKNGHNSETILQYFTTNDIQEFIPEIIVYTDGACIHNGKPNALAGIGVYFGENDTRNTSSKISGKQSNNTAELKAILKACEILNQEIKDKKKIMIYTDSVYSIRCCTTYGDKLAKVGWTKKKPIPNVELVQQSYYFFKNNTSIKLTHVKAHTNDKDNHSVGNDNADRLANEAIGITSCPYQKIYLQVPFKEKETAKSLGARWDPKEKKWYISSLLAEEKKIQILNKFNSNSV